MEFREKLQELRKARSLTQEELAEALFVSRTAVSKWESGRGYPSIDSLKEISRFFSITIDELICSEEVLTAAEDEKKEWISRYTSLLCGVLDLLSVMLLFLPVFGDGTGSAAAVPLYRAAGMQLWIRAVLAGILGITSLNGICGMIISRLGRPDWDRHRLVTGIALSVTATAAFIVTRQPYAGIVCFAILVIKGLLILWSDGRSGRKERMQ